MISFQIQAQNKVLSKNSTLTVFVDVKSKLPLQQSFEYIVPMDLEHIFKRYKNLPAVIKTSNKKAWYTAGMTRTVFFDDGTSSEETLLSIDPHSSFNYKVNGFTNSLRFLIKQINGRWTFKDVGQDTIRIEWTYEIVPKHYMAKSLIDFAVKRQVKILMTNALNIMKEELESGNLYRYERSVGNW